MSEEKRTRPYQDFLVDVKFGNLPTGTEFWFAPVDGMCWVEPGVKVEPYRPGRGMWITAKTTLPMGLELPLIVPDELTVQLHINKARELGLAA